MGAIYRLPRKPSKARQLRSVSSSQKRLQYWRRWVKLRRQMKGLHCIGGFKLRASLLGFFLRRQNVQSKRLLIIQSENGERSESLLTSERGGCGKAPRE